jgi:hypothetical protein
MENMDLVIEGLIICIVSVPILLALGYASLRLQVKTRKMLGTKFPDRPATGIVDNLKKAVEESRPQ